jgi:hypothetical protein
MSFLKEVSGRESRAEKQQHRKYRGEKGGAGRERGTKEGGFEALSGLHPFCRV